MLVRPVDSWNVSDTSPIPSFRISSLMPKSCGDVGTSMSKIRDVHFRGWECDCSIFTTKVPFGCSLEIVVSKYPLSSEIRTFCVGEGVGGKKRASMATVKWSGKELASKITAARRPSDQTPHGSRLDQLPRRITREGSVSDNLSTEPMVTGSHRTLSASDAKSVIDLTCATAAPAAGPTANAKPPASWLPERMLSGRGASMRPRLCRGHGAGTDIVSKVQQQVGQAGGAHAGMLERRTCDCRHNGTAVVHIHQFAHQRQRSGRVAGRSCAHCRYRGVGRVTRRHCRCRIRTCRPVPERLLLSRRPSVALNSLAGARRHVAVHALHDLRHQMLNRSVGREVAGREHHDVCAPARRQRPSRRWRRPAP